jgi:hypothetical protein
MRQTNDVIAIDGEIAEVLDTASDPAVDPGQAEADERIAALEGELAAARSESESISAEASDLRAQLDTARAQMLEAALKYREARLSAAPDVPEELVPESPDIAEIDTRFEAAQRIVRQVRENAQQDARTARVPAGAPTRRAPDPSSLSPTEKIRLGLERLAEN